MPPSDKNLLEAAGLSPMGDKGSALLGFTQRMGAKGGAPITREDGITARSTSYLSQSQLETIGSSRTFRASLNKLLTNLGDTYIARIRKMVARYGAYITGQFYSGFRQIRYDDHGSGFNTAVAIVNPVPYSGYVHPKRTPKSATILKEIKRDIGPAMRAEFKRDLKPLLAQIAKARIMSGAK